MTWRRNQTSPPRRVEHEALAAVVALPHGQVERRRDGRARVGGAGRRRRAAQTGGGAGRSPDVPATRADRVVEEADGDRVGATSTPGSSIRAATRSMRRARQPQRSTWSEKRLEQLHRHNGGWASAAHAPPARSILPTGAGGRRARRRWHRRRTGAGRIWRRMTGRMAFLEAYGVHRQHRADPSGLRKGGCMPGLICLFASLRRWPDRRAARCADCRAWGPRTRHGIANSRVGMPTASSRASASSPASTRSGPAARERGFGLGHQARMLREQSQALAGHRRRARGQTPTTPGTERRSLKDVADDVEENAQRSELDVPTLRRLGQGRGPDATARGLLRREGPDPLAAEKSRRRAAPGRRGHGAARIAPDGLCLVGHPLLAIIAPREQRSSGCSWVSERDRRRGAGGRARPSSGRPRRALAAIRIVAGGSRVPTPVRGRAGALGRRVPPYDRPPRGARPEARPAYGERILSALMRHPRPRTRYT